MGAIPVGDSDFSLSHASVMLISSLFTFHYRAYNSPSLFTYHNMTHIFSGMQQFLSKNAYIRILHRLKCNNNNNNNNNNYNNNNNNGLISVHP